MRLSICELALQAYKLDHGTWPESLADLTPEYLPGVPEDPFTDQAMTYGRAGQGYWLYCVPPDMPNRDLGWKQEYDFSYDGSDH